MTISRLDKGLDYLLKLIPLAIGMTIGQLLWPSVATIERLDGLLILMVVLVIIKVIFMVINGKEAK